MTREEAKVILKSFMENPLFSDIPKVCRAFDMAIKALEQESCNTPRNDLATTSQDCISRQAVLNTLFYKSDNNCEVVLNKELRDRIKALPHVTPTQKWIPVSERLPERDGWYLISLGDKTYGGVDVDMYCKGWVKYGTHVLAWMPLPEPYEPTN